MEGGTARPGSTLEPSPGRRVLLLIAAFWCATAWAEAVSRCLAPVAVKTGHQLLCSRRHRLVFELVLVEDGVVVPCSATARRPQILAVFCAAPAVARTSLAARLLAPTIATLRTARAAATGSAALSRGNGGVKRLGRSGSARGAVCCGWAWWPWRVGLAHTQ